MARHLFVLVLFALSPCGSWHGPGSESCVETTDSEEEDTTPTSQDGDASVDGGGEGRTERDASTERDAGAQRDAATVDDDDRVIDVDAIDDTPENEGITDASALD